MNDVLLAAVLAVSPCKSQPEYRALERSAAASRARLDAMEESIRRSGLSPDHMMLVHPAGVAKWLEVSRQLRADEARMEALCPAEPLRKEP